jgi:hypothetical protein
VKRYVVLALLLLILAGLVMWGDRIVGRALDDQLPPLLTRQLGLPVTIAPIDADVMSLTAKTPRLVMGSADAPAVIATEVTVSLDWADLVRGEIRLVDASAGELTLQLSNWPGNDNPRPTDYRFLDPWLPGTLYLAAGRYLDEKGAPYPVREALWKRGTVGASVDWKEDRLGSTIEFRASLDSLDNLLRLKAIELDLQVTRSGAPDSAIAAEARVSPSTSGGYELNVVLKAPGADARIIAGNDSPWRLPSFSETTVSALQIDRLTALLGTYRENSQRIEGPRELRAPLPVLSLPDHHGKVRIDEIRFHDELGKNTHFEFAADNTELRVYNLSSVGPRGVLRGTFGLVAGEGSWDVELDAAMQASETDKTLAPDYLDTDWIWQRGHVRMAGSGSHWQELLASLTGDIDLSGYHSGQVKTPVSITATMDEMTGDFALEQLEIQLGNGSITGEIRLSGRERPRLTTKLRGENLDLDFLFVEESGPSEPGIRIPEYLGFLPGIDIEGTIDVTALETPAFKIASAGIALNRSPDGGKLSIQAQGVRDGSLQLEMRVTAGKADSRKIELSTTLVDVDLSELFQQDMHLYSRTSGNIELSGVGEGLTSMFNAMRGKAKLSTEFRRDNNWQRELSDEERIETAADAALIIDGQQIVGLQLDNLEIDSIQQDVSARLTMRADTSPWLTADLVAERLDVDGLVALLPETTEEADRTDMLTFLKELGDARLSLAARKLQYSKQELLDLKLEITSGRDSFNIEQLDFTLDGNPLKSSGGLTWKDKTAQLAANVEVSNFELDRFLIPARKVKSVPVSGKANLASEGESFAELVGNVTGRVNLAGAQQDPDLHPDKRRRVDITASRLQDGMQVDIREFVWGRNTLKGRLRYRELAERPSFELTIDDGSLDLEPWEEKLDEPQPASDKEESSLLGETAATSARLINNILRAPLRLFSGPEEAEPGQKLFDDEPVDLGALQGYDAHIKGRLSRLASRAGRIDGVQLDGSIEKGVVALAASADSFNGGPGKIKIDLDTHSVPATVAISGDFKDILTTTGEPTFPRSGFFDLSSRGNTTASLAANLNGLFYIELGKGPFDYVNFSMFTADLASQVGSALIPGIEKSDPVLECGILLGEFKNGLGTTPAGYTLRTDKANLIGRVNIDLRKETLEVAIDSRSRQGVGLSVGNVFSNTIRVKGPLTDPQIVPYTTGILWRGWAAFMTAGLSVVGESILKRALAAENPCKSIKQDIRKEACGTDHPLASSTLVCP